MTQSQIIKYNKMLSALKKISKEFMTPDKLRKQCEKEYGLEYEEALEMAYENIQMLASESIKGIKTIKSGHEIKES